MTAGGGAHDVGSIIGYLKMDRSDWDRELTEAGKKADELARHNPDIRIGTNAPSAIAQLALVSAAIKRLQDAQGRQAVAETRLAELRAKNVTGSRLKTAEEANARALRAVEQATIRVAAANDKLKQSAQTASEQGIRPLSSLLISLGPALVPLLGGTTALAAAFTEMGAAAIVAIVGVKREVTTGTELGQQFAAGLGSLSNNLHDLEHVGARGVLNGFNDSVATLNAAMPALSGEVARLSATLGSITGSGVSAVVALFQTFGPLTDHVALSVAALARHFSEWASGPGGAHFASSIGEMFDRMLPALTNITAAVGHVIAAFAPVGGTVLSVVSALSAAIAAIPVEVLQGLATVFIALYTANKLATVFNMLSGSLTRLGASAGSATTGMSALAAKGAAVARFAGIVATVGIAAYEIGKGISSATEKNNSFAQAANNAGGATKGFAEALLESKGALDAGTYSAIQYQLQQDGMVGKAAKAGVTQDQLTRAIAGSTDEFARTVAQWKAGGKPSGDTIAALGLMRLEFQQTREEQIRFASQTRSTNEAQLAQAAAAPITKSALTQIAATYHLTTEQVSNYARMMGITADQLKNQTVSTGRVTEAVKQMSDAYGSANLAGGKLLGVIDAFTQSAGAAADKAALLGGWLVSLQGDALAFGSAMAGGYNAARTLTDAFAQQKQGVADIRQRISDLTGQLKAAKPHSADFASTTREIAAAQRDLATALNTSETAAIDAKKGTIDYTKAGAVPLLAQLQGMQDAAEKAAEALYQHEVATKGSGKAAEDAAAIFKTMTYDALKNNAAQLGLNSDAVTKLADDYFHLPKDVTTQAHLLGTSDIVTALDQIGEQLSLLTGKPWVPIIKPQVDPTAINNLVATFRSWAGGIPVQVILTGSRDKQARAGGGTITGAGGPKTDSVPVMASPGEEVIQNPYAGMWRPLLKQINSGKFKGITAGVVNSNINNARNIHVGKVEQNNDLRRMYDDQAFGVTADLLLSMVPTLLEAI